MWVTTTDKPSRPAGILVNSDVKHTVQEANNEQTIAAMTSALVMGTCLVNLLSSYKLCRKETSQTL